MAIAAALAPVLTERLVLTPISVDDVGELELLYTDALVARWTGPWTAEGVEV